MEFLNTLERIGQIASRSNMVVLRWRADIGWPVELVSKNVKKLTGYESDEFIQGDVVYEELISPNDVTRVRKEVAYYSSLDDCDSYTHSPYRIIHKDGHELWVDDSTTIIRDDNGKILFYEGVIIECTSRILAEQALREKDAYINEVEQMSGYASAEYISGTIHLYTSPNLAHLLNTEERDQNQSFETIEHAVFPADYQRVHDQHERFLKGPFPYTITYRITARDGEIRHIQETVHVDVDDCQEFSTIFSFRDITDEYYSHKKIELLEHHFHVLYECAPLPLWQIDVSQLIGTFKLKYMDITSDIVEESAEIHAELKKCCKIVELNKAALEFFNIETHKDAEGEVVDLFPSELLVDYLLSASHRHYAFRGNVSIVDKRYHEEREVVLTAVLGGGSEDLEPLSLFCTLMNIS